MIAQAISDEVYQDFLKARANNLQPPLSHDDFEVALDTWYREFRDANCSLGYAAAQLGVTQIDLIYILDSLGWKVTNL